MSNTEQFLLLLWFLATVPLVMTLFLRLFMAFYSYITEGKWIAQPWTTVEAPWLVKKILTREKE